MRWLAVALFCCGCAGSSHRNHVEMAKLETPKPAPAIEREPDDVAGFPLVVLPAARTHARKRELLAALAVLLPDVVKAFPTSAQRELRHTRIKLTERTSGGPYFDTSDDTIEIASIDDTLATLHEGHPGLFAPLLAAGWLMKKHRGELPEVARLWENAKTKRLSTASYGRGALEYYAVLSATWFGRSNVRADRSTLRAEDPEGAAFVARTWPRDELAKRPTEAEAETRVIQGFTVLVEKTALGHAETTKALAGLDTKLEEIGKLVPAPALRAVRDRAVIVLRWTEDPAANMQLYSHDGMIDILDVRAFLLTLHPSSYALLHECAHHYLGAHPELRDKAQEAYSAARSLGLYADTYAATNAAEYFAELSETYFAKNDYFPHTRAELEKYDPDGFRMIAAAWR